MAPRGGILGTSSQQILHDTSQHERPETDYERWQRKRDRSYKLGKRPQYGPPVPASSFHNGGNHRGRLEEDGTWRSHGYFVSARPSAKTPPVDNSMSTAQQVLRLDSERFPGSLLLFLALVLFLLGASQAVKRRRRQGRISLPLSGNTWDGSQVEEKLLL